MEKLPGRIRALRRRQQRTLKDIADHCGFTVSLLSKIESGKTTPPVATLKKISEALGVSLSDLVSESNDEATVLTGAKKLQSSKSIVTAKGYAFHVLAADRMEKVMQPFLFVAEKGKVKPGAMSHVGEEFIYVLEGKMRYTVGKVTHALGPGDSLYFDSEQDHDLEPLTQRVKYLAVFCEVRGNVR